jgi:hypothetical protein
MNIKTAVIAICMAACATDTAAQLNRVNRRIEYNNRDVEKDRYPLWQRISLGGGMHFLSNKTDFSFRTVTNEVYSRPATLKSDNALAASLDVYFPLRRFSQRSCFAISAGVNFITATLTHDTVILGPQIYQKDLAAAFIGVPIGVEYKTGGDAVQSKAYRTMFTVGVGIMPTYVQSDGLKTEGPANDDEQMKMLSYAKVEGGFFAGIAIKLRAMAYLGNVTTVQSYETVKRETPPNNTLGYRTVSSRGPLGFNLSLILMPGSAGWRKY